MHLSDFEKSQIIDEYIKKCITRHEYTQSKNVFSSRIYVLSTPLILSELDCSYTFV